MLTLQSPSFIGTPVSPTQTDTQDFFSPRRSTIATEARKAKPLDAPIDGFLAVHGHSKSIYSKVIGPKTVPGQISNVYACERMDFASNSIIGESPNFIYLGLSPANTADKLNSVTSPAARVEELTDGSGWIASTHGTEQVTVGIVSETKAYSDYIKNPEFETTKVFERENISVNQPTLENISVSRPTENIPMTQPMEFEPLT